MTPDDPLLKAVIAQPEDDTLRLAVADWFDENDRPARAEFIRVQVELAHGVPDRVRSNDLEVRQRDLLVANEAEWVGPVAGALKCRPREWGGWVFRRGFVEYFHLPTAVVTRRGEQLARLTPVRELFLRPATSAQVIALTARPWIAGLTAVYLPDTGLSPAAVRALIDCRHLRNLRVLRPRAWTAKPEVVEAFQRRFRRALP